MTNNQLMPEQRPDKRGVVVTRWVKPNVHGSSQKTFAPAPSTGAPSGQTERSRSLFEKVLDSLVNFLLGPEDKASGEDHIARDVLRQRLAELPERTVRNLSDAWEKAKKWADDGLDSTDFGKFSERVRSQVATLLAEDEAREQNPEHTARRVDDYADRIRRTTEARTEPEPQLSPEEWPSPENNYHVPFPPNVPTHEPTVQNAYEPPVQPEQDFREYQERQQQQQGTFSPLDDFFQEVDNGSSRENNSSIDDLMNNGRTRRHH